jgi:DhnA family fructose-bisphosphate aldolase class Ia
VGEALRIVYEELARNESLHVGEKVQGESEIYSFVKDAVGLSSKLAAKGLSYVAPTVGVAVSMAASGVKGGIMWAASAPKTHKTLVRVSKKITHEEFNISVGEAARLYVLASPIGLYFGSQQEEEEIIFGEEIPSLVEVEASDNVKRILRGEKKRATIEQRLWCP